MSTTLNNVNSMYIAVINNESRECEFTDTEVPQPIHCCLCYPSTPGLPLWNCIATTPSLSLLPSGEYSIAVSTCTYNPLSTATALSQTVSMATTSATAANIISTDHVIVTMPTVVITTNSTVAASNLVINSTIVTMTTVTMTADATIIAVVVSVVAVLLVVVVLVQCVIIVYYRAGKQRTTTKQEPPK